MCRIKDLEEDINTCVSRTHLLEKLEDVKLALAFTAEASVDSVNCSHGYGFGSGGQVSSLAQVLGRADTASKSSLCKLLFQESMLFGKDMDSCIKKSVESR